MITYDVIIQQSGQHLLKENLFNFGIVINI